MAKSTFVYVTYIRTTPEKLWHALTDGEFSRKYWLGARCDSDFKTGSPWRLVFDDGRVADSGEILESDPPRRLVVSREALGEGRIEPRADGRALVAAGEAALRCASIIGCTCIDRHAPPTPTPSLRRPAHGRCAGRRSIRQGHVVCA